MIIAISLGVQLPLALGLAILLAERFRGAVAFRMIFFLPYILADVAAGLIWRFMFDGDYGPISYLVQWFGYPPLFLLADRQLAYSTVLTVIVWKYFGFHMMLYIAGSPVHRPQPLRGGRHRRRERPAAVLVRDAAAARADDPASRCSSRWSARCRCST